MKYSDEQLISRVESHAKGFDGWRKGVYDIWVRSAEDVMDAFNDKVYTFVVPVANAEPEFRMVCTGTSHAGSYGLKQFHKYRPDGCAVACVNQIVYDSHAWGFHKGYRAYRQVKGILYTRDTDRDDKAENYGEVFNDVIGMNSHCAARGKNKVSIRIYNWSVACMVRNAYNQFEGWMAYMNRRPLSNAILEEF